jgi:hypothetical protein
VISAYYTTKRAIFKEVKENFPDFLKKRIKLRDPCDNSERKKPDKALG